MQSRLLSDAGETSASTDAVPDLDVPIGADASDTSVAIKAVIMDVRTRDAQVRGGRAPFLLPTQGARIDDG